MTLSSLLTVEPRDETTSEYGPRPRSILAVTCGAQNEDWVVHKAAKRCAANHARLAVINVWSAPRFVFFVALAGINPVLHGAQLEHDASEWLRRVVNDLDPDLAVSFASRNEPPGMAISREILAAPYDELIVSERLARQELPRVRRRLGALGVKLLVAIPSASMSNRPRLPLARRAQPVQP